MGAERQQGRNEIKFLGSLVLLVAALTIFVALLVYFAPEDKEMIEPAFASEETQLLRKSRTRPLRSEADEERLPTERDTAVETAAVDATASAENEAETKKDDGAIKQAVALIDSGNPEDALVILEQILSKDPRNERALIEISMVHLIDYRNAAAAVPWLERTLQVNPSNRLVLAELAAIYAEQNNVEGGLSFLQGLQEKATPENSSFISLGIGQMLMSDGREDEAVVHLERAAAGLPNNPNILSSLANTYARSGNSDKAVATYRKSVAMREVALRKLPADDKSRLRKRQLLLLNRIEIVREFYKRGDLDAASEELEIVSKYAPRSPLVNNWRKRIARRAG